MRTPRPEVASAFNTLVRENGASNADLNEMTLEELDATLSQPANSKVLERLATMNIARTDLENHVNSMQKSVFKNSLLGKIGGVFKGAFDVATWPVRKILWPAGKWVLNNPIKSAIITYLLGVYGLPWFFNFLAEKEFGFAKVAADWFQRYTASLRPFNIGFGVNPGNAARGLGGPATPNPW